MENESSGASGRIGPANDNHGSGDKLDAETVRKVDRVALRLAGIIGRRMAREDFERLSVANDNRSAVSTSAEDGADRE